MESIFFVLFAIVLIDFALLGIIPYFLRLWPRYRHLTKDGILLEDDTKNLILAWERSNIRTLILTKKYLILKNTYFTSVKNVNINSIESCTIKKKRKNRSKVIINFKIDYKKPKLSFKTDKTDEWVRSMRLIGIKMTIS